MTLLSIFGSAVPLIATRTRPHGPVKITESTGCPVMSEPTPEKKGHTIVTYEDIGGLPARSRGLGRWLNFTAASRALPVV